MNGREFSWSVGRGEREFTTPAILCGNYRLLTPRTSFRTFFLLEPRGVVRFALGVAFFRAARFTFLRSAVSSMDFVFAIQFPGRQSGGFVVEFSFCKNR